MHTIRTHLLLTSPHGRFCNTKHQKMASKKNQRMGSVRHKDVCGLLKTWCGVAKGAVTAEDCQQVLGCMYLCLFKYARSVSRRCRYRLTCVHTHTHAHTFSHAAAHSRLGANECVWGRRCWHSYGDQPPSSLPLRPPPPRRRATLQAVSRVTRAHARGSVCGWRG